MQKQLLNLTLQSPDTCQDLYYFQDMPLGLLNVSSCKFESPAYVSYPHFYLADPKLIEALDPASDLKPDKSKHESYLSLDHRSGIPLEVAVRMQINGLLRPVNISDDGVNYLSIKLTILVQSLILILSISLSYLTYKFIEKPFRYKIKLSNTKTFLLWFIPLLCTALFSIG